jgi:hypothetical protein
MGNDISQNEIVLIDKDGTLGYFYYLACGMFDGAKEFLEGQKKLNRDIYVATCASTKKRDQLIAIENNLDGFFGNEDIDVITNPYYEDERGKLNKIYDDFVNRERTLSLTQRVEIKEKINEREEEFEKLIELADSIKNNSNYWDKDKEIRRLNSIINKLDFENLKDQIYLKQLVHKKHKIKMNPASIYRNPNCKAIFSKDINLTKRLISPSDYELLRCVMVGDEKDVVGTLSDPKTPLIVVSQNVKLGDWGLVELVVNKLFCDSDIEPHEVFDELIGSDIEKKVLIGNRRFTLRREGLDEYEYKEKGRVIYCP